MNNIINLLSLIFIALFIVTFLTYTLSLIKNDSYYFLKIYKFYILGCICIISLQIISMLNNESIALFTFNSILCFGAINNIIFIILKKHIIKKHIKNNKSLNLLKRNNNVINKIYFTSNNIIATSINKNENKNENLNYFNNIINIIDLLTKKSYEPEINDTDLKNYFIELNNEKKLLTKDQMYKIIEEINKTIKDNNDFYPII